MPDSINLKLACRSSAFAMLVTTALFSMPITAQSISLTAGLEKRYQQWNGFVENMYSLHKARLEGIDYRVEESIGGYGGTTDNLRFYTEKKYFDNNDRLLSVIKWENRNPENIHMIDVYTYDDEGRMLREYSASYLPSRRRAPFDTTIVWHYYKGDLHSIREFDASDVHLYEQCQSISNPAKTHIALHYEDIPGSYRELDKELQGQYRECFDHTAVSAVPFTNPMAEFSE
jgi:hypothetical protein